MDPYHDFELEVDPATLQAFDQMMNLNVQDIDLEPESSGDGSNLESEAAVQVMVPRNDVLKRSKSAWLVYGSESMQMY